MENALRPLTGLFGTDMRLRLKRTALPPAGVTPRLRTGRPTTELALRLLALIQALTVSPSFKARSSARHTSRSAPDADNAPARRMPDARAPAVRIRWKGLREERGASFIRQQVGPSREIGFDFNVAAPPRASIPDPAGLIKGNSSQNIRW